jgi:hypothetical protein
MADSELITTDSNTIRYNWYKKDWDIFSKTLNSLSHASQMVWKYLHDQPTDSNLDRSAKLLRDMILDAVKQSTPDLQLTTHSKCWWTPQLKLSQTQMNHA